MNRLRIGLAAAAPQAIALVVTIALAATHALPGPVVAAVAAAIATFALANGNQISRNAPPRY